MWYRHHLEEGICSTLQLLPGTSLRDSGESTSSQRSDFGKWTCSYILLWKRKGWKCNNIRAVSTGLTEWGRTWKEDDWKTWDRDNWRRVTWIILSLKCVKSMKIFVFLTNASQNVTWIRSSIQKSSASDDPCWGQQLTSFLNHSYHYPVGLWTKWQEWTMGSASWCSLPLDASTAGYSIYWQQRGKELLIWCHSLE